MKIFRSYTYTWWHIAIIKLALVAVGMILGAYLASFVIGNLWIFIAIWVTTAAYILWHSYKPDSPTRD
jgi:hypothetical protein